MTEVGLHLAELEEAGKIIVLDARYFRFLAHTSSYQFSSKFKDSMFHCAFGSQVCGGDQRTIPYLFWGWGGGSLDINKLLLTEEWDSHYRAIVFEL